MYHGNNTLRALAIMSCALFPFQALAQQAPDAGLLLKQQPKPPVATPIPVAPKIPVAPMVIEKDVGPTLVLKAFVFKGALLVSKDELSSLLKSFVGKEVSFRQLQSLPPLIVTYYAERGYLARVLLPPQEIKNGVVTIRIIEGKRGSLKVEPQGKRIDRAWVKRFIEHRMSNGAPMNLAALGEAMAIINEQPGIESKVALLPGKGEGDVDLNISATATPLVTGSVGVNNQGSRSTGESQGQGVISINNPSGHFDAASLLFNAAQGSTYARSDYSLAVGNAGLRLGVNASYLRYHIVQSSLSALGPRGSAETLGLTVSYPVARREDMNLSLNGSFDYKKFIDKTIVGETGNRLVSVASLGLKGFVVPKAGFPLAGGITSFGISMSFGDSKQRNAGALATDRVTRKADGTFTKLNFSLGHIRPINADWNFNANLRGQWVGKNLDSAERFSLGGTDGVRAYPVGESYGDKGWLLNLNVRRKITEALATSLFFDAGGIILNDSIWSNWNASNPRLVNRYELYGTGVSVDWRFLPNALLNASLAVPIGNNPGRDSNNFNADGRDSPVKFWLSLNAQF